MKHVGIKSNRNVKSMAVLVFWFSFFGAVPFATAEDYDPTLGWQTRQGAILCDSYFQVKEAEAAVGAKDDTWFKQTGCARFPAGIRLLPIDTPTTDPKALDIWKARLYPPGRDSVNVHLYGFYAVNFASAGKVKSDEEGRKLFEKMESAYRDVFDKQRRERTLPYRIISGELLIGPEDRSSLHFFCYAQKTPCTEPSR